METLNLLSNTNKEEEKKSENTYVSICYNKKWLILGIIILILLFLYIYYYEIKINIPFCILSKNKNNKKCDNLDNESIDDTNDDIDNNDLDKIIDEWDIKEEIQKYMDKQHEYISEMK